MDRELTQLDFTARHKLAFDIQGNELTPSARYDFKFKDYAPWVFRDLRKIFQIDAADYLVSLTGKYILSELGSPGKSGSFFYFSRDYRFIIKTLHHAEHKFLRRILPDYHKHTKKYPNTLISQFYGLHRVKTSFGKKIHFVVMNNLFPPHMDIHSTYDVKGSTVGRITTEDDKKGNPRGTLKDLNWLNSQQYLKFSDVKKAAFLEQVQKDVELLAMLRIMDYSLLLGIHNMHEAMSSPPVVVTTTPERTTVPVTLPSSPAPLIRTPSVSGQNYRHRDLRRMVTPRDGTTTLASIGGSQTAPIQANPMLNHGSIIQNSPSIDRTLHQANTIPLTAILSGETAMQQSVGMQHNVFYQFEGGIRSQTASGSPGDVIYFLGIIDLLTNYGSRKRLEHFWKGLGRPEEFKQQISAVPPLRYAQRFRDFVSGMTKSPAEVEKSRLERTPSAINLESAVHEMHREHIGPLTPEPDTTLRAVQAQDETGDLVLPVLEESSVEDGQPQTSSTVHGTKRSSIEQRRRATPTQRDRLTEVAGIQEARRVSLDELQGISASQRRGSIVSVSSEPMIEEAEPDGHDSGVATSLDCLPEESEPSRQSSLSGSARAEIQQLTIAHATAAHSSDLAPPLTHDEGQTIGVPITHATDGALKQPQQVGLQHTEVHRRQLSAEEKAARRRGVVEAKTGHGIHSELERRASIEKYRVGHTATPERFEDEGYAEMSLDEASEFVH